MSSASVNKDLTNGDKSSSNSTAAAAAVSVAGPSSRPSPSKQDVENLGRAMQLLAAGKRDLLISDPNAAVMSLAQACELLGDHYGEVAYECAEAYYYYGVALLDLARMEAGVIDNVMDGIPDDEEDQEAKDQDDDCGVEDPEKLTEDEKVEVAKQVDQALDENYKELEKLQKDQDKVKEDQDKKDHVQDKDVAKDNGVSAKGESEGDDDEDEDEDEGAKSREDDEEDEKSQEDEEDEEDEDEEGGDEKAEKKSGETDKAPSAVVEAKDNESIGSDDKEVTAAKDQGDASAVEKEDEEDPSNLQLAWEMLDLAKTILLKKAEALREAVESDAEATKTAAKEELEGVEFRISDAYQTLGELSIENENYPQAIEDLNACLAKRQSLLPEDSRCIAETHYQLGVAQGFYLQFEDAVGSLNGAIQVLQKRIDNLKNKTESKDPQKAKDAFYTREKEIAEIEKLIPEIREKIADTEDMKRESHKRIGDRHLLEDAAAAASASTSASSSGAGPSSSSSSSSSANPSSSTNGHEGSSSKEASTISSTLIKKRKKSGAADEGPSASGDAKNENKDDVVGASSSKKPHLDEAISTATNGHKANGN